MKIETAKIDLQHTLSTVSVSVGTGTDITSHYLFRVKGEKIEILSQNLRVFAGAPLVATHDGEDGDAFTVEAWRLDKWVSGVGDGVLTFEFNGGGDVHAKSGRSKVRLRSLDPSKFPYWDGLLGNSKDSGKVDPLVIVRALSLTKNFVSTDDTAKPELCQIEAIDGTFWATDRRALCCAEVPVVPELNIRIPGKDIPAVSKFLSDKEVDEISVKTAERSAADGGGACVIFEKTTGHYLGVTRPTSKFPTLSVDPSQVADSVIDLDMEEVNAAISVLQSSAPKGYESLTFRYDTETEKVVLSMPSEAGGTDEYPLSLAEVSNGENFDTEFTIDYAYLKGIVSTFSLEKVELGVNKRGRGGFTSFKYSDSDTEDSNKYYSVIVWKN